MTKELAVAQYASPALIPANLKRVAVILDNGGVNARDAKPVIVTLYNAGDVLPRGLAVVGGVVYSAGDTIPPDMQRMVGLMPSGAVGLNDGFNGTAVDTGIWTVTDTGGKITVSGGNLVFAGGVPGWGDPLVKSQLFARVPGLAFMFQVTPTGGTYGQIGWHSGTLSDSHAKHGIQFNAGAWGISNASADYDAPLLAPTNGTSYLGLIVLAAAGAYSYVSATGGVSWSLIGLNTTDATATLYAFYGTYNRAFTSSFGRVYRGAAPAPVYSGVPSGIAPALGAELATGALTVGEWYQITASAVNYFYTGSVVNDCFRATAATALDANNKVKQFTLATLMTTLVDPGKTNGIYDCAPAITAQYQGGLVFWYLDDNNYLQMYHDRTNAYLIKKVAGVTTGLVAAAGAYADSRQLRAICVGTKVGLYYNNILIGATQTIADSLGTVVKGFQTKSTDSLGASAVSN